MLDKRALVIGNPKCQLGVHPLDLFDLLSNICRRLDCVRIRLLHNRQRNAVLAHEAGVSASLTAGIPYFSDIRKPNLLPTGCWDWQEAKRFEAFDGSHATDGVFRRALLCDTRRKVEVLLNNAP